MQTSPFLDKIATLRNRLPDWMEWTVAGVYLISIVVGSIFMSKVFAPLGTWTAIGTAIAVSIGSQVVRFLVVFFDQLNPQRPALNLTKSYVAALGLGGLAIYEVVELISTINLPFAAQISVGGLMLAGMVIEIYALRELQHATNYAFFSDPVKRQQLEQFYYNQAGFNAYLKNLRNQIATGSFAPTSTLPPQEAPPSPQRASFSTSVLDALGAGYNITSSQMTHIRNAILANTPDAEVVALIESLSAENRVHSNGHSANPLNIDALGN
jgi:hypothetical protein